MKSSTIITRSELFDLLWREPMTKLFTRWGITRQEIIQICEQYDVPRPPSGYWAQLNWGTAPERPSLPTLEIDDLIEIDRFRTQFDKTSTNANSPQGPEITQAPIECLKAHSRITVPDKLIDPHKYIRQLKNRDKNQIKALSSATYSPNQDTPESHILLNVSKDELPRALRIIDAVLKNWESRGFEVDQRGGLSDGCDHVAFSVCETYKRVKKEGSYWEWKYIPTGSLTIGVNCQHFDGLRRSWNDGKTQKLETILDSFLASIPRYLTEIKQSRLDRECVDRQNKLASQSRAEHVENKKAETKRREELFEQIGNWENANRIRSYLLAVDSKIKQGEWRISNEEMFTKWNEWAHWYADLLCPLSVAAENPYTSRSPTNTLVSALDLTSSIKEVLSNSGIIDTDELYSQSKESIKTLCPNRSWHLLEELDRVLEGLGYDMAPKNWTYRPRS